MNESFGEVGGNMHVEILIEEQFANIRWSTSFSLH